MRLVQPINDGGKQQNNDSGKNTSASNNVAVSSAHSSSASDTLMLNNNKVCGTKRCHSCFKLRVAGDLADTEALQLVAQTFI